MICIHPVADSWSDRWAEICTQRKVPFLSWDIFQPEVLGKLRDENVQGVLFDLPLFDRRTAIAARHMVRALEAMGILVFPNHESYWHYDDKIAQVYLFQMLQIPSCPTWVFYDAAEAIAWAARSNYPKVWKLKNGAASSNVMLVNSESQARRLIRRAFGAGHSPVAPLLSDLKTKAYKHKQQRDWSQLIRRLPQTLNNVFRHRRDVPPERGYAYFQEFLPGNSYDTRITVIGNRAFGFRRFVRTNDFRASGSGRIDYDPGAIDLEGVSLAFDAAARIGAQCLAFDIVYLPNRKPVVLEVCYRFVDQAILNCAGFWDRQLVFHSGKLWPQDAILEDFLETLKLTSEHQVNPKPLPVLRT